MSFDRMLRDIDARKAGAGEIKLEPPKLGDTCAACGEGRLILALDLAKSFGSPPRLVCPMCGKEPRR